MPADRKIIPVASSSAPNREVHWCTSPYVPLKSGSYIFEVQLSRCQWEWKDDYKWVTYDERTSGIIEDAHQGNLGSVTLTHGYFANFAGGYVIDFGTMTQTKVSTGYKRTVRRRVGMLGRVQALTFEDNSEYKVGFRIKDIGRCTLPLTNSLDDHKKTISVKRCEPNSYNSLVEDTCIALTIPKAAILGIFIGKNKNIQIDSDVRI